MCGSVSVQAECAPGTAGPRADSLGRVRVRVREWSYGRCLIVPQISCKLPQPVTDMAIFATFLGIDSHDLCDCSHPGRLYNSRHRRWGICGPIDCLPEYLSTFILEILVSTAQSSIYVACSV